jgi:hypothetical protein
MKRKKEEKKEKKYTAKEKEIEKNGLMSPFSMI